MIDTIVVEVVNALPHEQRLVTLRVEAGTTAAQAIAASGLIDIRGGFSVLSVGIFGKPISLDAVLRDNDRVEIYRPLIADAKQVRRQKAAVSGSSGKK